MTDIEDQLERRYGYGFDPPQDLHGMLLALDALTIAGLLTPERAQQWRERFERSRAGRRPEINPGLRAACLALLDGGDPENEHTGHGSWLAHHFAEMGLISRADFERVNARVYELPDDEPDEPAHYTAPLAVALGPPPGSSGLRVIWIATYDTAIELGLHRLAREGLGPHDLSLHDAANAVYERHGWLFSMQRGHIRFTPRPAASTVELRAGTTSITLTVP